MAILKASVSEEIKEAWAELAAEKNISESALLAHGVREILRNLDRFDFEPVRKRHREGAGQRVELRLTKTEAEATEKAAIQHGFSSRQQWIIALIRANVLNLPTPREEELDALREANKQLRMIGVNMNQIARAINIDINNLEQVKDDALATLQSAMRQVKKEKEVVAAVVQQTLYNWTKRHVEDDY